MSAAAVDEAQREERAAVAEARRRVCVAVNEAPVITWTWHGMAWHAHRRMLWKGDTK